MCVLQAVFDLPSRMQAALEEDALDSAVSFYAEALPVLRKYGHKGAFRGVAVQADAAAKQISTALKRRLAERKDETEHVVLLLRQLGEGDDTLQVRRGPGNTFKQGWCINTAIIFSEAAACVTLLHTMWLTLRICSKSWTLAALPCACHAWCHAGTLALQLPQVLTVQ
jgi:hypothetical protein